ncbi:5-dehydro-4-deoxyglucarate dehydratase [Streptomyces sp. ND04-05B]|uniref:5-dehydro-4-deoxyglucarate dehydratase n=1 Tax=Streptomyces sp. ND04-05B TaxID=3028693 RepID=UPI0029BCDB49|nr:5-dehydro-4-deoxyglucarate dehydratase [Streptomyces sp. ND04-05B]MDX3069337.1 5-dehydro-4-deoxyglucarate dehydratase [Streptomyces sp. ND04-05B]
MDLGEPVESGQPVDLGEPVTSAPLAARLRVPRGPLFFPVTAYGPDGGVDPAACRAHVRRGVEAGAAAVFVCCGTGEFHALTPEEFQECVRAAVAETAGRVPVVAGAGYGTALAVRYARLAEEAGADGLLALPPYLVVAAQEGLLRHYRELAAATSLPVVVYQRDNAVFTPHTVVELARTEGIVGLKDGHSDLDRLQRLTLAAPEGFLFFNGAATAEIQARAYAAVGVPAYSSAVHAFAPEIAGAFFDALRGGDDAAVDRLLRGFYVPFVELRDRRPGYAVSLVKAAARLRGRPVGPVRAPLTDPSPADLADLEKLLSDGLDLVGGPTRGASAVPTVGAAL